MQMRDGGTLVGRQDKPYVGDSMSRFSLGDASPTSRTLRHLIMRRGSHGQMAKSAARECSSPNCLLARRKEDNVFAS